MSTEVPDNGLVRRFERALLQSPLGPTLARWHSAYRDRLNRRTVTGRRSELLADTFYRALVGRPAVRGERAEFRTRAAEGTTLAEIAHDLQKTPEGSRQAVNAFGPVLRSYLRTQLNTRDETPATPRLVFLHIPKTGGTSLSDVLAHWVGPERARVNIFLDDLVLCPPPVLAVSGAISGHLPFEALSLIPPPFHTIVVLRDPIERTLSNYGHIRRGDPRMRDLTLERFVSSPEFNGVAGNLQARYLAHDIDLANAWRTWSPEHRLAAIGGDPSEEQPLYALFENSGLTQTDDELLEKAKRNLETIDFVGITESLDSLSRRISVRLGFPREEVPELNSAPTSVDLSDVSPRILHQIEARTAVDRDLFDLAKKQAKS